MTRISTRIATTDDIAHIVDIFTHKMVNSTNHQDLLMMTEDRELIETIISNRVNNPDLVTVIAFIDTKILGSVTLNLDTSHMGVLYTTSKPRGVKQALITKVLHEAHKHNLASVVTQFYEPSTEMLNLAHKNNFEVVTSRENQTETMFFICVLRPAVTQLMVTAPLQALNVDLNRQHEPISA